MKISLNWLKKYVDIKIPTEELIRLIGARLVEVEDIIDESKKYDNIFVVKVVECEPIEGTHLHRCLIDAGDVLDSIFRDRPRPTGSGLSEALPVTTGESERVPKDTSKTSLIQVICGAPNVHSGMLAAWIAPGATVPASVHEDAPFIIGTRKMLGKYESHGMLAGADELDFGDDHSGIVEIDPKKAQPGDKLSDVFELDDIILDIENKSLTHRPDCFGIIGFAREVAGILGEKFEEPEVFAEMDKAEEKLSATIDENNACALKVKVADSVLCPCYSAAVLDFTRVPTKKKYLTWQDTVLSKSGMRPIDPIVDLTNYLMLLTGQPLHAFDYDKFVAVGGKSTPEILVRQAKSGEKLELLDDKEVILTENDIVIASNDTPVALAGAMGGKNTAIDENTQKIILESATFSLYNLRKTQMAHGIFSEAITRFTKGQPAANCLPVLAKAVKLLGNKTLAVAFSKSAKDAQKPIIISVDEINALLGTSFDPEVIEKTLSNVGFQNIISETLPRNRYDDFEVSEPRDDGCERTGSQRLCLKAPSWRTDISIKEDIIEEVGRLLGYDNIAPTLPLHGTVSKNPMLELKKEIRHRLSAMNAHELLTYTFIHGDLLKKVGQNPANSYKIVNSISPDLQYIRQTIAPSLMVKASENLKSKQKSFALFEMNQVFAKDFQKDEDGVPTPENHLAFIIVENENKGKYFQAKLYSERLCRELGVEIELKPAENLAEYYEPKRSATIMLNHEKIGALGEIKNQVANTLKLPRGTAIFELDLDKILGAQKIQHKNLSLNEFPSISRDLTVISDAPYAEIFAKIEQFLSEKDLIFEIRPVSIYQSEKGKPKSTSFHLEIASKVKTLDSKEAKEILDNLEKIS